MAEIDYKNCDSKICIDCCQFGRSFNSPYCSYCYYKNSYNEQNKLKNFTVQEVLNMPFSVFKKVVFEDRLIDIFHYFEREYGKSYILINNNQKYNMLQNLCSNKNHQEVWNIMKNGLGKTCMLTSKYGDKLLEYVLNGKPQNIQWKLVHAIGPFILDPWNSTNNNSVFVCYYRHRTSCPCRKEDLYYYWNASLEEKIPYMGD